jgi:hypothetical protein
VGYSDRITAATAQPTASTGPAPGVTPTSRPPAAAPAYTVLLNNAYSGLRADHLTTGESARVAAALAELCALADNWTRGVVAVRTPAVVRVCGRDGRGTTEGKAVPAPRRVLMRGDTRRRLVPPTPLSSWAVLLVGVAVLVTTVSRMASAGETAVLPMIAVVLAVASIVLGIAGLMSPRLRRR